MRRLVFYGALAAAVTAAGVTLIAIGGVSDGGSAPAAQPPDNPGDTAPGRPTTTTTEPDPGPTVEQARINGFGTVCSSDDLCLEYSKPYDFEVCDENGEDCLDVDWSWAEERAQLLESGWPAASVAGERQVAILTQTFRGENLRGGSSGISVCMVAGTGFDYDIGYGQRDGGIFVGQLPLGTPPLDLPDITTYQFEVLSPAFGSRQIFITEPTDVAFEEFGDLVSDYELTDAEIEAVRDRPLSSSLPICQGPGEAPVR